LGSESIRQIHERVVKLARKEKLVRGRKLRRDTTVVETNIHYPTDSRLLGGGVRVLTRTMRKIEAEVGRVGNRVRSRIRSVRHRLLEIGKPVRSPGEEMKGRQKTAYRKLMRVTRQVVGQAEVVVRGIDPGTQIASNPKRQLLVVKWSKRLTEVSQLTRRVFGVNQSRSPAGRNPF
jgi:IS5 family transposase